VTTATQVMPDKLPVPPKIIAKIIEIAAEPECTTIELAQLIQKDPTLTAQVLRAINAAYYGLRQRVESVPHATAFMGISAVRNLVLCIGVQQLSQGDAVPGFPLDRFWEGTIQRAAASACLARRLGVGQPDDSFTTGLCQDIGVLVNLTLNPAMGAEYAKQMDASADARLRREIQFGSSHAEMGADLLRRWRLPQALTDVIQYHHSPDEAPPRVRVNCMIALAAEAIADLLSSKDKAAALEHAIECLIDLELPAILLRDIVDEVIDEAIEAATMLQLRMGAQPTFEEIAAKASDALMMLNIDGHKAEDHTEHAFLAQKSRTAELEQQNEELKRRAATDPLTGLPNRRLLDDQLARELAQAERQRTPVTVLMVDIDRFKQCNDSHGHSAGDCVLKKVAHILRSATRRSDTCARFGGEEFAVILPYTDEEPGLTVAERIRRRIESEQTSWEGHEISVTVSIGGVTVAGSSDPEDSNLAVRAADLALYRAKGSGRNRVCWHEPAAPESRPTVR